MALRFVDGGLLCALLLCACGDDGGKGGGGGGDDTAADDTGPDVNDPDLDHDGYPESVDCDDNDYAVNPGETEACDEVDNDCDEEVDEGFDADDDGFFSAADCAHGDDCDDSDASINLGAEEVPYDGVDQDCDGADLTDVDGDSFDAAEAGGNDCDDLDAAVFPGAPEVAKDGIDQDCDGADNGDGDGDGHEDEDWGGDDCDDADPAVHPGAFDWMNDGLDIDCDGVDGRKEDISDAHATIDGTVGANDYTGMALGVCDLDLDGLDDLLVTAPLGGKDYQGLVGVFSGAGSDAWGPEMTLDDADVRIAGDDSFMGFGIACTDVDGDGILDLVTTRGAFNGPSWGLFTDFGVIVWYGDGSAWPSSFGDDEADAELSFDIGPAANEGTVYSRSFTTGDLDGDGAAEILVNMTTGENGDGSAQLGDSTVWVVPGARYTGDSDLEDAVAFRIASDGTDVTSVLEVTDDLDGDGVSDLVFGQALLEDSSTGEVPGRLSVLSGVAAGGTVSNLEWASFAGAGDMGVGWDAAIADIDGDGVLDALVAAPFEAKGGADEAGALYFVSDVGSALTGTGLAIADVATGDAQGQWGYGYLGTELSVVGDVDGDGVTDVLVYESAGGILGDGRVRLLNGAGMSGSDLNPEDIEIYEWEPEEEDASTGSVMAGGDFDGDGRGDPVIAAPNWTSTSTAPAGRVYVFLTTRMR